MNMFFLNILLAVMWGMATGQFSVANLTVGFVIGYWILRFSHGRREKSAYFIKTPLALRFVLFYLWQLFLANLRVAYDVLVPGAWSTTHTKRLAPRPTRSRHGGVPAGDFPGSLRAPLATESFVCPGVIGIPLDARTDLEIAVLANLITLTPGSVSLDLSADRSVLYIHAMYIDDGDIEAYRRDVKEGLERRVLELLR